MSQLSCLGHQLKSIDRSTRNGPPLLAEMRPNDRPGFSIANDPGGAVASMPASAGAIIAGHSFGR